MPVVNDPTIPDPPGTKRPNALNKAMIPAAIVVALISLFSTLASVDAITLQAWFAATAEALGQGAVILFGAQIAKRFVTPTSDPRNDHGELLVPAADASGKTELEQEKMLKEAREQEQAEKESAKRKVA